MSKSPSRDRGIVDILVRSAESRPRAVKATGPLNGRAAIVTPEDKKLAEAVLRRHRS